MLAGKYRVVAMSTRGTDMSDKPQGYEHYASARIADDISAIIGHFGEDRATIVGQDSGGLHAWYFAMTHPEQTERLISLGSVHPAGLIRELIDNPEQQAASAFQWGMQENPEAGAAFGEGVRNAPVDPNEPPNLAELRQEASQRLDAESVVGFYKMNWPARPVTLDTVAFGFKYGEFSASQGAHAADRRPGRAVLHARDAGRHLGVGRRAVDDPGASGSGPRTAPRGARDCHAAHDGVARDRPLAGRPNECSSRDRRRNAPGDRDAAHRGVAGRSTVEFRASPACGTRRIQEGQMTAVSLERSAWRGLARGCERSPGRRWPTRMPPRRRPRSTGTWGASCTRTARAATGRARWRRCR